MYETFCQGRFEFGDLSKLGDGNVGLSLLLRFDTSLQVLRGFRRQSLSSKP